MHKLNVQILGPASFVSTLNELKNFLKFNPKIDNSNNNTNIILFHVDVLMDKKQKEYIDSNGSIKICVGKKNIFIDNCDASLELPATLKEINAIVENTVAKKKFNRNSSIEIKSYLLNKNEKKLSKLDDHIVLTEKEVQLLELFLYNKKPISKVKILSSVWNYSSDADTHTVETHIYRLRKKISDKFMDEKFILNNKDGYYF
ncbi:MAG: winged helix-turn-helix domain-containing protein [Candidatus Pelagibacter bacterium]|nr:winged helix-turn-helix domain-containing protein [Candidatus Pelagibacter bacterium]